MSFNRPKTKYFLRPSADQDQCKLFGPLKATSTDTKNVIVLLQNKTRSILYLKWVCEMYLSRVSLTDIYNSKTMLDVDKCENTIITILMQCKVLFHSSY